MAVCPVMKSCLAELRTSRTVSSSRLTLNPGAQGRRKKAKKPPGLGPRNTKFFFVETQARSQRKEPKTDLHLEARG